MPQSPSTTNASTSPRKSPRRSGDVSTISDHAVTGAHSSPSRPFGKRAAPDSPSKSPTKGDLKRPRLDEPSSSSSARVSHASSQSVPDHLHEPLKIKKLVPHAVVPKLGSRGAAGYDLSAAAECVIPARGMALISTGLAMALPPGVYGRVAPRSGLAVKHRLDTGAGVVDSDYRGEVKVVLFNFSDQDYHVKVGDRVAQLILERILIADVAEVEELDATDRGAGGFGSTGVEKAL
ncbi:dUTP diphosphatase [Allomyces macrogynus ATCC 38327]|uniref:Deoxyuridine 5'-triphosphate nucleotidohydrolase n=1 Tax=Allomyces macrogynus (strain ATCC 38327) TaxID=578462 RepID=A0A0L0TBN2_ALLM3|nr:dUTP diphosphatase [Allomyces macrogynus ATCC 38327]|eukprot:KNE72172.1 dUTP diphosphatase [Allomyces macrogynus ATCC 38327]